MKFNYLCIGHFVVDKKKHFNSSVTDCTTYIEPFHLQAYDLLGLYFGIGRTFFNPASVSIIKFCDFTCIAVLS